jgi:hypothetical protein
MLANLHAAFTMGLNVAFASGRVMSDRDRRHLGGSWTAAVTVAGFVVGLSYERSVHRRLPQVVAGMAGASASFAGLQAATRTQWRLTNKVARQASQGWPNWK